MMKRNNTGMAASKRNVSLPLIPGRLFHTSFSFLRLDIGGYVTSSHGYKLVGFLVP
jgi:hypothetical protein